MCLGVSGTSWLTGGENTKARSFSKLICVNHSPVVVSRFKTHAAVKQDSLHLQGTAEGERCGGCGSSVARCYGKGESLPKIRSSGGGVLVISWLHCS